MINKHPDLRSAINQAVFVSLALLFGYAVIYLTIPFSEFVNKFILSLLTVLSAVVAAGAATLVYSSYEDGEPPRLVWRNFSLGFWSWVLAEIIYSVEYLFLSDVLVISPVARLFWFIGFIFFTIALIAQYQIIYGNPRRSVITAVLIWVGVMILALLILLASNEPITANSFLKFFNSLANLVIGIVALLLLLTFRGGILSRPWWGFLGFAVADILYFFIDQAGAVGGQPFFSNLMILLTHIIYMLAYLILALGFYVQYLLLKYGIDPLGNSPDE
jgi:hypothetical protein